MLLNWRNSYLKGYKSVQIFSLSHIPNMRSCVFLFLILYRVYRSIDVYMELNEIVFFRVMRLFRQKWLITLIYLLFRHSGWFYTVQFGQNTNFYLSAWLYINISDIKQYIWIKHLFFKSNLKMSFVIQKFNYC